MARLFAKRYQFVIRNVETFSEKSSPKTAVIFLIVLFFTLFLVLASGSFWLSTSCLARWYDPTYMEQQNKKKLLHLTSKVASLEKEALEQANFIALLQNIIQGDGISSQQYVAQGSSEVEDSLDNVVASSDDEEGVVQPLPDLPKIMDQHEASLSSTTYQTNAKNSFMEGFFLPPIAGHITRPLDKKLKHYGIDLVGRSKAPIKSIAPGVVVFAAWTMKQGWVIAVQHHDLLSIYQHCDKLLKEVGNFVGSGDVIAIVGNSGELSAGDHLHLEIWHQGRVVDPQQLIAF